MPVKVSEFLAVDPKSFEQLGVLDAILDVDTKLFIDPHLVEHAKTPELAHSYSRITKFFAEILKLLALTGEPKDAFWRTAERKLIFREPTWLCIGYSKADTRGSGIGPKHRQAILKTAREIIKEGINDPQIFELIRLMEEGIGPDRISDMVAHLITPDLLQFSHNVFESIKIKRSNLEPIPYGEKEYFLPRNPFNGYPIVLLPKEILRDLPIALDWSDIDIICAENQALREKVNEIIGNTWKDASTKVKKDLLRSQMLRHPELISDVLEIYKKKPGKQYDFENDPAGQIVWLDAARNYTSTYPLSFQLSQQPTPEEIRDLILVMCKKFGELIENNGLNKLLYRDDALRHPKKEEAAQSLFYGVADCYCESNNVDISREPNAGRGPVDFKFSKGYNSRVLVEVKLSKNNHLIHGFQRQLVEYQKAEKTTFSIYLIILVGSHMNRVDEVIKLTGAAKAKGERIPDIVVVDARKKPSASHV